MSDIQTWSNTAASNNATPPNGFPEGMAPSTVNDAARELMAAVSRYRSDTDGVNTSAGTNTITLAASRTMTAYAQGDLYTFKAGGTNTGATTLNVDSLGAKDVQFNGAACTGGEIVSGLMYTVVYDGTQFQLLNASSYPAIDITTLEVTNIKAKDGTASMTIANSTGNVSAGTITTAILNTANAQISGGNIDGADLGAISQITTASIDVAVINTATIPTLNSTTVDTTNIEATNIKAKDGTASFAIADSTGIASFSKATIIATTDNTNAALRVTQLGTANALEIEDNTNPDATPIIVNNAGSVILGSTTQPVVGTVGSNKITVSGASAADASFLCYRTDASAGPSTFTFGKTRGASPLNSGDVIGRLEAAGRDATTADGGDERTPAARIEFSTDGAVSLDSMPGKIAFQTTPSGSNTPVERMSINNAGTVTIGGSTVISVTDNTNAALRVTQLGTANALEIEDSTNPDATPFIVNASGNLIQGYTTAVASKILTTATTPAWQAHGVQLGSYSWTNNATFPGFFVFNKSKSGTVGTLSAVTDGDSLGVIQFNGADNDATPTFNPAAYISAQVAGTVASTSIPGRLNFATTAAAGTSPTVRVSITPEGYLGVGATPASAQQLLDLRGTNNGLTSDTAVNTLRFTDTDTTTAANQPIGKIEFASSDLDNAAVGAYILASSVGTAGGGTIRFGAAANAGAVAEVARVASTGLTVTLDTAGLGYGTGTGGTVTQATSRTTGVTLNKTNGSITLVSAAGTATWQSFTVTNSTVAATDVVVLSQRSGTDLYMLEVTAVAAGSFRISFATTGGTTTEQPVFNFAVIKAVTS